MISLIQAVRRLLSRVASADVTMHEIEGGAHELFIGLEREQVTEHILDWLNGQLSPDTLSEVSGRLYKSCSMVSVTGNPFDWRPAGMSPAESIYGMPFPMSENPLIIHFPKCIICAIVLCNLCMLL